MNELASKPATRTYPTNLSRWPIISIQNKFTILKFIRFFSQPFSFQNIQQVGYFIICFGCIYLFDYIRTNSLIFFVVQL
jgi:hypothetical protein